MSASEKLKALAPYVGTADGGAPVLNALPQLVAVVEQLECVLAPWEKIKGPLAPEVNKALAAPRDALAALEEALP